MKRWMVILMIWLAMPRWAWADDPGTKLGRGLVNTAFGWFEIVNEMGSQSDKHGPWIGFPSGLVRGTVFGIGRTLAGVYETVTFLLPNGERGYEPVILPATPWVRR